MDRSDINEEMLQDYVDGRLSIEDQKRVDEACERDASLKETLQTLMRLDDLLSQSRVHAPSDIAERVWTQLEPKAVFAKYKWSGLLVFSGVVALIVAATFFGMDLRVELLGELNNSSIDPKVPLPEFNFSHDMSLKLLTRITLLLTSVLALLILDRAVLKPFFQRRNA